MQTVQKAIRRWPHRSLEPRGSRAARPSSGWRSAARLNAGALLAGALIVTVNSAHVLYHPPGVSGGMILRLVLNEKSALLSSFMILALVLTATFVAVSSRLRQRPADLLGGTLR